MICGVPVTSTVNTMHWLTCHQHPQPLRIIQLLPPRVILPHRHRATIISSIMPNQHPILRNSVLEVASIVIVSQNRQQKCLEVL